MAGLDHSRLRTLFPQHGFASRIAGFATLRSLAREFIRDLPYLSQASRSQVFTAEDDATMADYEMAMAEQFKLLLKKFGSFETKVDGVGTRLDSIDAKLTTVDGKVTSLGGEVTKMRIELEQTHGIAKLGLGGLEGLRQSTDEHFAKLEKKSDEQIDLLKLVLVDVRKRVDKIEPPKARRRRS